LVCHCCDIVDEHSIDVLALRISIGHFDPIFPLDLLELLQEPKWVFGPTFEVLSKCHIVLDSLLLFFLGSHLGRLRFQLGQNAKQLS
jgi:hypothetical protein